jgi:hypothetical protein
MSEQFDYLSRILATPMPRSKALKLMFGALAAAALAPLGLGQGEPDKKKPQQECPKRHIDCGGGFCCPPGKQCCHASGTTFCCPGPHTCCGNSCCPPSKECRNNSCVKVPTTPSKP